MTTCTTYFTTKHIVFCISVFLKIPSVNSDFYLNEISHLAIVMVEYCLFFAVRTELLNVM
jgi:hypothetical protein